MNQTSYVSVNLKKMAYELCPGVETVPLLSETPVTRIFLSATPLMPAAEKFRSAAGK
jgi:hypothetical protein